MNKEFAIELADRFSIRDNCKYYVIHQPDNYNEIFNNSGYKVTPEMNEKYFVSLVYETK